MKVTKFKKRSKEVSVYLRSLNCRTRVSRTKFIIFHQGRTGSELLRDLLNSHPEIHCDSEILDERVFFPLFYLRCFDIANNKNIYGFKAKLYQLERQRIKPEVFISNLASSGWKIIYLNRLNILQQAVSIMLGENRKKWHYQAGEPLTSSKVYIDCNRLMKILNLLEKDLKKEKEILSKVSYLKVIYEEDLLKTEKQQKSLDRVFNYLSVASAPVKTTLVKSSSDRFSDSIQNHDKIIEFLSKTKYAKFLNYSECLSSESV